MASPQCPILSEKERKATREAASRSLTSTSSRLRRKPCAIASSYSWSKYFMLAATIRMNMTRGAGRAAASRRTAAIGQHLMSTTSTASDSTPSGQGSETVLFESNSSLRTYILNRPNKLNVLNDSMLSALRQKIEEWNNSDLCGTIVGRGAGRAFCAGGDVEVAAKNAADPVTRPLAVEFFQREFELDFILAALKRPYVAVMDGITFGGGFGLAANAPFRIATEKTNFAMPETKIGYCPDVGGNYFLSRLDGQIGTYLALTSDTVSGRAVFEHGIATHFIPSRRIPMLLDRLAELERPHPSLIDRTIEELSEEPEPTSHPPPFTGPRRVALDYAFRHNTVEAIIKDLEAFSQSDNPEIVSWASNTLSLLHMRSPTSLKVALQAIRRGKRMTLLQTLEMELRIATAFCRDAGPDFFTGVRTVITERNRDKRPDWSPGTIQEITPDIVARFFEPTSPFLTDAPSLNLPAELTSGTVTNPWKYTLPTEEEIRSLVTGSHVSGGGLAFTLDELLARFAEMRPGKMGVKEKVLEVVQRKCELTDNNDGNRVWLKWKHQG